MSDSMRLDRFLWFARVTKSRSAAQAIAEAGHLRIDGRPIDRAAAPVRTGNILTVPISNGRVRIFRVEGLPQRRGPPAEALACYQELTTGLADDGHLRTSRICRRVIDDAKHQE